jgi:hypothetical protein
MKGYDKKQLDYIQKLAGVMTMFFLTQAQETDRERPGFNFL